MLSDLVPPEYIVLMAGGALTLAYLIINQVVLRVFILAGTALYIWYYWVVADAPLWTAIYTSLAMGVANLIGLGNLFWRQSRFAVPHAHRDIYSRFANLPPGDFRELVTRARRFRREADTLLTREGAPVDRRYYVISGDLTIEKRGETFHMPSGVFVGEVAYVTQQTSAATSRLTEGAEVLEWEFATLRRRSARASRFKLALEAMISRDQAMKVASAVAPRQADWGVLPVHSHDMHA